VAAGFSPEGLEALAATAATHVDSGEAPGVVALVAHGDDVHVEAHGRLSFGGRPIGRDSLFRIASTSKPITAAATMALVQEGQIGLDEPIDALIPELSDRRVLTRMDGPLDRTVDAWRAITARDLLTFTFGFGMAPAMFTSAAPWPIATAERELALNTIGPPRPDVKADPDAWIANFGKLPLIAQPGERWLYNTGATVLSVLASRAAGQSFDEVLRTRIFEPLGMRDTSFWSTDTRRLATSYQLTDAGPVVWDEPNGAWSRPPAFCDGAAGLLSSADDLLAFARMLLSGGGQVLMPASVHEITSDQLTADQKSHGGLGPNFFKRQSWGYCLAVAEDGAYGWDGGLGTTWRVDPAVDLVVIVLTQVMFATSTPPRVHRDIQQAAYAAVGSARRRDLA
jgi:CubicO group peptidase (beta-lactamase class C family)